MYYADCILTFHGISVHTGLNGDNAGSHRSDFQSPELGLGPEKLFMPM